MKSQEELLNAVDKKLDKLRTESKIDDVRLNNKLDNIDMEACKRFLIVEMTKLEDGLYAPSAEQKRVIYETKERYNDKGGDSYVDSMFEGLQKRGIL